MAKQDVIIKFVRSDNVMFLIDGSDWIIPSNGLSGLDFPTYNLYTKTLALQDASVVTGSQLPYRNLKISAVNLNKWLNNMLRRQALSFFNPKYTYTIYITYMGNTFWIVGDMSNMSLPSENIYARQELTVSFQCIQPYLKSMESFGRDLADITGRWAFPYIDFITDDTTPTITPVIATFSTQQSVFLKNNGDVPTKFTAIITFDSNVTNPTIICDKKFFKLLGTFKSSDKVTIVFEDNNVYNNNVNIVTKVSKDSTFDLSIAVGGSYVSYTASSGIDSMHIKIYYNELYGGM